MQARHIDKEGREIAYINFSSHAEALAFIAQHWLPALSVGDQIVVMRVYAGK